MTDLLAYYKDLWELRQDGDVVATRSSVLQPVLHQGTACMLKIAIAGEERRGNKLMVWLNGTGAAQIYLHDEKAILMERAAGKNSLAEMAANGQDDEASRIICSVMAKLHRHSKPFPENLAPLEVWFKDLYAASARLGGVFSQSLKIAEQLLSEPEDVVVLHGDIHHGNILDFGEKEWLAIDPKGLVGERGFDYANLFCNPDKITATIPGRLERQVKVVSDIAHLEPGRLLKWIAACAGLSAAWSIDDEEDAETAMTIAQIALSKLNDII